MLQQRNLAGYSVMELMITLVVIGIILALAYPSLQRLIADNRLVSTTNSIVTGLNLARSEAITRRANIGVCPSQNGQDCNDDTWRDGWLIYEDTDLDGRKDNGEPVLRARQYFQPMQNTGLVSGIVFNPRGTAAAGPGSLELCPVDASVSANCRRINITLLGGVSTEHFKS